MLWCSSQFNIYLLSDSSFASYVTAAPQRNPISRCPGWAQQCTSSCVQMCRKKICPGAEPVVFIKAIPWCFGATPCWNTVQEQSSGEGAFLDSLTADLTTLFTFWSKHSGPSPRQAGKCCILSCAHSGTDAGLRMCVNGQIRGDCCVSLLRPILKKALLQAVQVFKG